MTQYQENFAGKWLEFFKENLKLIQNIHTQLNAIAVINKCIIYPNPSRVYRAFNLPLEDIKVVILGQDPYHDGSATGLAFDNQGNKIIKSPSLQNIRKECINEGFKEGMAEIPSPSTGSYLGHLPPQGVLLLNTALTVEKGKPNSHAELWAPFTLEVIKELNKTDNIIWILWGANALSYKKYIGNLSHKFIISSHPSPLSFKKSLGEYPSFFGSAPFSKANNFLKEMGKSEIKW